MPSSGYSIKTLTKHRTGNATNDSQKKMRDIDREKERGREREWEIKGYPLIYPNE